MLKIKDEIKVEEYIRTDEGIIAKIKRIESDKIDKSLKWYVFDKKRYDMNVIDEKYINKPYIKKHSSKIIDLIEEDLIKYRLKNFEQTNIGMVEKRVDPRSLKEVITVGFYRINQVEILKIITKEELEKGGYEVANV